MRFVREVRPEPMVDFADLLQDPNPIHLDEAAARGRVINQGPINAGYVIAMLREAYPDATITALRLRFKANVRGGDTVTAGGPSPRRTTPRCAATCGSTSTMVLARSRAPRP